jgi:hypothetical protein
MANVRTIGAAAGTIMALIMTAHMTKSRTTSTTPQAWCRGIAMPGMSAMSMPGIVAE